MIYSVTYFNPLGNCDNTTHVEADNEVDAALIAHAEFWVASKPFDLGDYTVLEYDPDFVIHKDDIFKRKNGGWTPKIFIEKKKEALKAYVKEDWIYGYKKDGEKGKKLLIEDAKDKFGSALQDIDVGEFVENYIKEIDAELDKPRMEYDSNNQCLQ